MVINSRLSNEELLEAIYKAALEYSKLIGNSYMIIGKNKNSGYFWFECYFEKKHFMHLLGVDSKTLSAVEFYDKCEAYNNGEGEGLQITDCHPSRNPITLIPRNIDEFVSVKYKIIFVLQKNIKDLKYKNIIAEVKKGLFSEIYEEFPDEIKDICEMDS